MRSKRDKVVVWICILATAGMLFLSSGFEREHSGERAKVQVLQTNDNAVRQFGIVKTGDQSLKVRVLQGAFKDREVEAVNHLIGKLEFDRIYSPGDTALATLDSNGKDILKVTVVDYYRLETELLLFAVFSVFLLGFGGWTGLRSLLSFVFTGTVLWKILLPGVLRGWNPIVASLAISALLTVVINFLVSGVDKKGVVATLGALAGIALTCGLSLFFGRQFSIHGAVKPFSETLLYSGFAHLDLTGIFLGGIFLASSGAVMDLGMDIASALNEIVLKNPKIERWDLIQSGFAVGRMVIGTMTTTLLLAYTGGFMTLLMVFVAQGTPAVNILNLQYVAAEVLHTLVGSIGLVAVAPLTAILGGYVMTL
ncbi:MAG: YibE/F family protein [Synergistaceae bacterium]|jgi:uncharacterized membrane protein|nr:YibE/F family protein [Synergistaceae bacterium]